MIKIYVTGEESEGTATVAALLAFWLGMCNGVTVVWDESVPLEEACDDVRFRPYQGLLSYAPTIEVVTREVPPNELVSETEAIAYLAQGIWRMGELKECQGVLDPDSPNNSLRVASRALEHLEATHYGLAWLDRRKKLVHVALERCEDYGAVSRGEVVLDAAVDLS